MRLNVMIDKDGNFLNNNPNQNNFLMSSSINGNAPYSLFLNQLTVEFYNEIITLQNGLIVPDQTSVVKTGLSGTIQVMAFASPNAPYVVDLVTDNIDVSETCILQWQGITQALNVVCTSIVGANYINLLLDRN